MSERADTAYSPRFREEEHSATADEIQNLRHPPCALPKNMVYYAHFSEQRGCGAIG